MRPRRLKLRLSTIFRAAAAAVVVVTHSFMNHSQVCKSQYSTYKRQQSIVVTRGNRFQKESKFGCRLLALPLASLSLSLSFSLSLFYTAAS